MWPAPLGWKSEGAVEAQGIRVWHSHNSGVVTQVWRKVCLSGELWSQRSAHQALQSLTLVSVSCGHELPQAQSWLSLLCLWGYRAELRSPSLQLLHLFKGMADKISSLEENSLLCRTFSVCLALLRARQD